MHPRLEQYVRRALSHIETIPQERKHLLDQVAEFVSSKRRAGDPVELTFICTHNSRRSLIGQLWAAAAAAHFGIEGVRTYSGGTEATAFHPRAVTAIEKAGFATESSGGDNPRYHVTFDDDGPVMECFSKRYDDPFNPAEGFAAIMTCSEADEACPVVSGAGIRASIQYEDPKVADGTPEEASAYDERCLQIATEMLYLFSRVSPVATAMEAELHQPRPGGYLIQGRTVTLPCIVRDACSATATWLVSSRAAQALLPGPELEIAEIVPGRGLLSIACIDYRDNDLGDYNEVSIAFFVRKRGDRRGIPYVGAAIDMMRGLLPTHIIHLPVNQSFTCEAGQQIWGFPKTVDEIDFDTSGDRARCVWNKDGQNVLKLSLPKGGEREFPEQMLCTYSYIDGALHKTPFASSAENLGIRMRGAAIELGAHPIADELRSLGLPKPALMSMWMGKMKGRFEAAERC